MTNHFLAFLPERLTPREYEVLQLMAKGHSNQEIANELYKSVETVKTQLNSVYSKLDIRTGKSGSKRVKAIQVAQNRGWL